MSDKASSNHNRGEDDVVEIKKALATGSGGSQHVVASSVAPIVCYCMASILMTVVNKFVVSGSKFNMNFLLLCIQSSVCVSCVYFVKKVGLISFRDFDSKDAKNWFPISVLLVGVIYTGSKSLAYGEVIWFGGRVTGLTLVSFILMVASSIIAAWADISDALAVGDPAVAEAANRLAAVSGVVTKINVGYFWMFLNCGTSAAYVLTMRKRIKLTGFSDWDTMFYNNLLSIPVLAVASIVAEDWGYENLTRNFPPETRNFLLFAIAFSGGAAVGISYTTAWCIRATSSTTYSMVGALNKLPVAASGMIFFGDPVTFGSVTAVGVGFFAGLVYAVAKNNQKKAEAASQPGIIPLANRAS
ncbi:UDP-galactose transporter [Trametes maxima]|nr:UDP-galactose transporter [Trametes maxima]